MNNLREKIMKELDQLLDVERGHVSVPGTGAMHYDEIVDNLEALVVGYSVDVTSVTCPSISAAPGQYKSYELQESDESR
jgi:hypothetical protein